MESSSLESLHFRNVINIAWFDARELGHLCSCNILALITQDYKYHSWGGGF